MATEEGREFARRIRKKLALSEREWQILSLLWGLDDGIQRSDFEVMRAMYRQGVSHPEIHDLEVRIASVVRRNPDGTSDIEDD